MSTDAGRRHSELEVSLRGRVHNTLFDLVEEERIGRVEVARYFLYVSAKQRKAKAQIRRRKEEVQREAVEPQGRPSPAVVIEVLVEIIHGAKVEPEPAAIAARVAARGMSVTVAQVEALLEEHGLRKRRSLDRDARSAESGGRPPRS